MSEFIDFGKCAIPRHLIRQVNFIDEARSVVVLDNGNVVVEVGKHDVMQKLNPPPPRYPNAFYLANQETK